MSTKQISLQIYWHPQRDSSLPLCFPNNARNCGVSHYTLCIYWLVMLIKYCWYDTHATTKINLKHTTNVLLKKLATQAYYTLIHMTYFIIIIIIIIICYHLHEGYLQLHTWNNMDSRSLLCCCYSVFTVYGTCNVISQDKCLVLLH